MAFVYTGEMVNLGYGRGWANRATADSIFRIDRRIGHALQVTEAGRTWGQQDEHYQRYLKYGSPIALSPNTPSLHQIGNAIDSNEAQRIHAIMEEHGFRRTVYRWVNGVWTLVEPWHYEYFPELDKHRNAATDGGAVPFPYPQEDDTMAYPIRRKLNGACYTMAPGFVTYEASGASFKTVTNVLTTSDTYHDLDEAQFDAVRHNFQIPWAVLNIITQPGAGPKTWSQANDAVDRANQMKVTLAELMKKVDALPKA